MKKYQFIVYDLDVSFLLTEFHEDFIDASNMTFASYIRAITFKV